MGAPRRHTVQVGSSSAGLCCCGTRPAAQRRRLPPSCMNAAHGGRPCAQQAPGSLPCRRTDCVALPDGTPDNFADILAHLQNVHAFVSVDGCP